MARKYAVIENNTVINVIVGVEPSVLAANPDKYIDCTDGWDFNNGIDGATFFPAPLPPRVDPATGKLYDAITGLPLEENTPTE